MRDIILATGVMKDYMEMNGRNASFAAALTSTTWIWDDPCGESEGGGARPFINVQQVISQDQVEQVDGGDSNDIVGCMIEFKEDDADLGTDGHSSVVSEVVRADSGNDID